MPVLLSEIARMDYFISGLRVYRLVEITEFEATCACILFKHSTGWHEVNYTNEPHKLPLTLTVEPCILSPLPRKVFLGTRSTGECQVFTTLGAAKDWVADPYLLEWANRDGVLWESDGGSVRKVTCST